MITSKLQHVRDNSLTYPLHHFINGEWVAEEEPTLLPIFNPSTGEQQGNVFAGTIATVEHAVAVAKQAFPAWKALSSLKRARLLFNFKSLLEQNKQYLAELISAEHGKVISDALGEVQRGIEVVEFACGAPHLLKGSFSPAIATGMDCYDMHQPIGVCAGITPFNFPAMVPLWMFPLALVCGNTFILKPSEKDPSAARFLAELLQQAGVPNGVFNVVHGDKTVVDALLYHPDMQAISFVGSTPIAKYIYEVASRQGKRVQALGGAKNHCVVMPDADIQKIASGIVGAAYGSAGERCMAVSVVVAVGNETANKLVAELKENASRLKVGASNDPKADMGPIISAQHRAKIMDYIQQGITQQAELVLDGRNCVVPGNENGFYLGPSLFDRVTDDMTIYQDEIFGPVLCVMRVETLMEAMQLINRNHYANGAVIYTQNGGAAHYFTQNIDAGMIGVNVPIPVPMAFYTFGGWKNSLFGGHHMYGEEGLRFYTRIQTISARWECDATITSPFHMPTLE